MKFLESDLKAKDYILSQLKEAFASGSSEKVMTKLVSYLQKKIGQQIFLTPKSMDYENSYGKFSGYFAIIGNGKNAFRINFLLGKSDYISSIDYYEGVSEKPLLTVEFAKTDNIVEIATSIEAILRGDRTLSEKVFKERKSFASEVFMNWVNQDERYYQDLLQNERFSDLYRNYFEPWVDSEGERPISVASFNNTAKAYLADNGLNNKYARKGSVKKGSSEKAIVNKAEEKKFDDEFALTVAEKYEQIEAFSDLLVNSYSNGFLVVGNPGIGKTHTILERLQKTGIEYTYASGAVKTSKDLYRYLYHHREGEVIIFDDCDSVISKGDVNLLKSALDTNTKKPNMITFLDKDFKDPAEIELMGPKMRQRAIPNTFEFSSGCIFISNLRIEKINPALKSRSLVIDLYLTKEEILNRIEDKLDQFPPDIPRDTKLEVLNFFRKYKEIIKSIDFRAFDKVATLRMTNHPAWPKWAMSQIA